MIPSNRHHVDSVCRPDGINYRLNVRLSDLYMTGPHRRWETGMYLFGDYVFIASGSLVVVGTGLHIIRRAKVHHKKPYFLRNMWEDFAPQSILLAAGMITVTEGIFRISIFFI